ncbi:MAG: PIN domain-containing protein [Pseudomonadota bacterium]
MTPDCFLDTNILVYAATADPTEADKRQTALRLIETEDFALSAQVLQEFFVTVTRKFDQPMSPAEAMEWLEQLEAFPCMPIDTGLVKIAVEISERHLISYWDGAVIAAARKAGAALLYSEDLSDGQVYDGVRVVNPFSSGAMKVQDGV